MTNPTGFLEIERRDRGYEAREARLKTWREFVKPLPIPEVERQATRCMSCGIPFCHTGCPVNNLIPDWNDLVSRDQWREASGDAALDQQLPGVHRPRLPGAVRGGLHAQPRRQPGDDQDDRVPDRRSRLERRLDHAAPAAKQTGTARGHRRFGSGRHGLRPAARPRRTRRDRVREERPDRRPAALRHPRLQDGEVADRPPHRADGGRRRGVPARSPRRQDA